MPVPGLRSKDDFERMFDFSELGVWGDRWGHKWRGSQKLRYRIYINILQEVFEKSKRLKVLDIGCGQSDFLFRLQEMYPGFAYYGTDISDNVIAWNRENYPFIRYKQIALPEIGYPPSTFDLICATEVLYYLEVLQQKVALDNIVEALKPGAYLLLSGPHDGGRCYFAEDQILHAVGEILSIDRVEYNYARLYTYLERYPLRALHLLCRMDKLLSLSDTDFEQRVAGRHGWIIRAVIFARRRGIRQVIRFGANALIWLTKKVLGWEWLPELCFVLTKLTMGNKGKSHIIILARKSGQ